MAAPDLRHSAKKVCPRFLLAAYVGDRYAFLHNWVATYREDSRKILYELFNDQNLDKHRQNSPLRFFGLGRSNDAAQDSLSGSQIPLITCPWAFHVFTYLSAGRKSS